MYHRNDYIYIYIYIYINYIYIFVTKWYQRRSKDEDYEVHAVVKAT